MQFEIHSHREAQRFIPSNLQKEVTNAVGNSQARKPLDTQKLRKSVLTKLHEVGWSDGVRVDPSSSKIDITSIKSDVGLCMQTGNISRCYADLLKLQTLYIDGKISCSICIVPKKNFAKKLGQNLVNYERLLRELTIFFKTITVPILIYGIEE